MCAIHGSANFNMNVVVYRSYFLHEGTKIHVKAIKAPQLPHIPTVVEPISFHFGSDSRRDQVRTRRKWLEVLGHSEGAKKKGGGVSPHSHVTFHVRSRTRLLQFM